MFLTADVSTIGLAIAVAVLGLIGAIIAARISAEASKRQTRASAEASKLQDRGGRRERTAQWQLYKRDVYAELLAAARDLCSAGDNKELQTAYFAKHDRALLCAEPDLRKKLRGDFADPIRLSDEGRWDEFVDALREDARFFGVADSKKPSKAESKPPS